MAEKSGNRNENMASHRLKGIFILLLLSLWLVFAVLFWNGRQPFYRLTDCMYLTYLQNILDGQYFNAVRIYLHFAPAVFAAYFFTVILPDALGNMLKDRKAKSVYTFISVLCVIAAVLMMLCSCTEIPSLLKRYVSSDLIGSLVSFSDAIYLWLTPAFLILSPVTVLAGRLKNSRKQKSRKLWICIAAYIFCILTGMMIAAVSCLMLAVIQPFLPEAAAMVQDFCRVLASSASMCLIALIFAPLIEETVFRGLFQHHLRAYFRVWAAILISAAAFGLWHRNAGQFVYTFYFGLIAGAFYNVTGKLRHTVLIHLSMNLSAVLAFSSENTVLHMNVPLFARIYEYLFSCSPLPALVIAAVLTLAAAAMIRILYIHYEK